MESLGARLALEDYISSDITRAQFSSRTGWFDNERAMAASLFSSRTFGQTPTENRETRRILEHPEHGS